VVNGEKQSLKRFGTFNGVFTPAILTILGVVLYLRGGWVVGNAGLLGALLIILLAHAISFATGLSLSSITTNIRIGPGGAYSIITKSLGPEMGGSIGIPLYCAQTLAVVFYIYGFAEGWVWAFPGHDIVLVAGIIWICVLFVSYLSARLAIRIQYFIMAIIGLSLLSIFLGKGSNGGEVVLWGNFPKADFWKVYAIFFPAVTGIMSGVGMSGELKDPKRNIPYGVMTAIGVGFIIYIVMAIWLSLKVPIESLVSNKNILADLARWKWLVLMGLMGATLSSALGSIVASPRILEALARQRVIPLFAFFSKRGPSNEPRNAILFSGFAVGIFVFLGRLDTIAPLLTMFFLLTYGMINAVVFIEQSIGIASFRPTFRIPRFVSLFGAIGSIVTMILISPLFTIFAGIIMIGIYATLVRRNLRSSYGDVRVGLFQAIAEWSARTAMKFPYHARSWKPHLLLPVENPREAMGLIPLLQAISHPQGSLTCYTVIDKEHIIRGRGKEEISFSFESESQEKTLRDKESQSEKALMDFHNFLKEKIVSANIITVHAKDLISSSSIIFQVLAGMFLRPNIILLTLSDNKDKDLGMVNMAQHAVANKLGVLILRQHPKSYFGRQKIVNLWIRDKSPNKDLSILLAIQLAKNWEGKINLLMCVPHKERMDKAKSYLRFIIERARIREGNETHIFLGSFKESINKAPTCDVSIFGLAEHVTCDYMREISDITQTSCIFVRDSGQEKAFV